MLEATSTWWPEIGHGSSQTCWKPFWTRWLEPGDLKQVKEHREVLMGPAGRHFDQDGLDNPERLLANMLSQAA